MIKTAQGREATKLTKWLDDKAAAIAEWKSFQKQGAPASATRLGTKAMKFAIIIPVIVATHIVGRVMGAFVKTPYEKPVNPKLK